MQNLSTTIMNGIEQNADRSINTLVDGRERLQLAKLPSTIPNAKKYMERTNSIITVAM